jgi:ribonuclease HI
MRGAASMNETAVSVYCDGASRGNPGPAAYGVAAFRKGEEISLNAFRAGEDNTIFKLAEKIGERTNNEAEYFGIIRALEKCLELGLSSVVVHSDSELVIRQLRGEYKVKNGNLKPLFAKAHALAQRVRPVLVHIPREKNQIADYLANLALDCSANSPFTNHD